MIATRSMQLTVKKTTRTFKTLEGQLLAINDEKRVSMSTRCTDLDAQMPLYIGVSRAILENVIFCHQEESLWPLSEPSVLKKKFDEIFESQKFTKALDNIKSLRKEYAATIKIEQNSTEFYKQDKDRARAIEDRAVKISEDIDGLTTQVNKIKNDHDTILEEIKKVLDSSADLQDSLQELSKLRSENNLYLKSIDRLKASTSTVFEGTDEELQKQVLDFDKRLDSRAKRVQTVKAQIAKEKTTIEGINKHYRETNLKEGQLEAASKRYHGLLSARTKKVCSSASVFELPEESLNKTTVFTHSEFADIFGTMHDVRERHKLQLESEKTKNAVADNESSKRIQQVVSKKLKLEHIATDLANDIRKCTEKIANLKRTVESTIVDEATIAYEKSQLVDLEKQLAKSADTLERIQTDNSVQLKETRLAELSTDIDKLNADLKLVNEESENRAKILYLQEDLAKREAALRALISAKKSDFATVNLDIETLTTQQTESGLRDAISATQKVYDEAVHKHDTAKRELSLCESRLDMNKKNIEKLNKEKKELLESIYDQIDFDYKDYDEKVSELEIQERTVTSSIGENSFLKNLNERAVEVAEKQNLCLMCCRKFQTSQEKDGFLSIMEKKDEHISDIEGLKTSLEQITEALKIVRDLSPSISRLKALENGLIPYDLNEQPALQTSVKEARANDDATKSAVEAAKTRLEHVESLRRASSDLVRNGAELTSIRGEIETVQAQLRIDTGELGSSSQILGQISVKNEESKRIDKELRALLEERDQARILANKMESAINKKKLRISDLQKQLDDRNVAEAEIKTLDKERLEMNSRVAENKQEIEVIALQVKEQETLATDIKLKGAQREQEISVKYARMHDVLRDLENICKEIDAYEKNGGDEPLKTCRALVETLQEQLNDTNADLDSQTKELTKAEMELADLSTHDRMLKDNVEIRRLQRRVDKGIVRIQELEGMNIEAQSEKLKQRENILNEEKTKLFADAEGKMGEIKQLHEQLEVAQLELDTTYKDIGEKYRRSLIKMHTLSVASDDLAKYAKALDSAIMKYHSMKMEEINRIIDELWKKTYSGTDVDTILIRSENESARGNNRTYNYRVCMIKQDVELDMRGRCSAGQKVLASIIIRLALAECFGVNCGLIALDEPTTNLDQDNIESLAKALGSIIATRKAQKNFQLIVITHDEKFLLHMNAAAYTDHFYRVSRNDRQRSTIDWVPITRISE